MASQVELIDTLAGLALFADLSRPQLEAVVHTFEEEYFADGQRILRQGFSGSNLYVIVSGQAAVHVDGTQRATLARGDVFGEISVLLGEPPAADVVAGGALRGLALPGPEVGGVLLTVPPVSYDIETQE